MRRLKQVELSGFDDKTRWGAGFRWQASAIIGSLEQLDKIQVRDARPHSCQQLSEYPRDFIKSVCAQELRDNQREAKRHDQRHGIKTLSYLNWLHHIFIYIRLHTAIELQTPSLWF